MEQVRELVFFEQHFAEFIKSVALKVKAKIDEVLFLITVAEKIPAKFFKHVEGTDGLFEIRVEYESNIYRIFCCFDKGKLVVLFNGFQKKTQKTPPKEIAKALELKQTYFKNKKNENEQYTDII